MVLRKAQDFPYPLRHDFLLVFANKKELTFTCKIRMENVDCVKKSFCHHKITPLNPYFRFYFCTTLKKIFTNLLSMHSLLSFRFRLLRKVVFEFITERCPLLMQILFMLAALLELIVMRLVEAKEFPRLRIALPLRRPFSKADAVLTWGARGPFVNGVSVFRPHRVSLKAFL